MAVVAGPGPDLAMPLCRIGQCVRVHQRLGCFTRWLWSPSLRRLLLLCLGLPPVPGAFGHIDQLHEPGGRHARLGADHLDGPREGPGGPRRSSSIPEFR